MTPPPLHTIFLWLALPLKPYFLACPPLIPTSPPYLIKNERSLDTGYFTTKVLVNVRYNIVYLGGGRAYTHVAPTHTIDVFCFSFSSLVVVRQFNYSSWGGAASEQWPTVIMTYKMTVERQLHRCYINNRFQIASSLHSCR